MSQAFQRTIEDFTCEHCGRQVAGNGFTNHCPACLWSKHVDINPGDRLGDCGGMMKPVGVVFRAGEYSVYQRCEKCGFERLNKLSKSDDFSVVLKI
jgi:DNA-directed RNA polymerase subunit RPC12/RpoP